MLLNCQLALETYPLQGLFFIETRPSHAFLKDPFPAEFAGTLRVSGVFGLVSIADNRAFSSSLCSLRAQRDTEE